MLGRRKIGFSPSPGEQSLAVAYLGITIFGAILAFSVVNRLGGSEEIIRPLNKYDYWIIFSGAVGAFGGLYVGRVWLGFGGLNGWARAFVAVPVISFIAALIGGTLALPGHGTMFGPLALLTTMIANPLLAMFWCGMIVAAHYRFLVWRAERDTIFQDGVDA